MTTPCGAVIGVPLGDPQGRAPPPYLTPHKQAGFLLSRTGLVIRANDVTSHEYLTDPMAAA